VLRVANDASKPEIKAAVEALFKVRVEQVRVLNVKGKERRTRHGVGRRSDWKKAYVRLAVGQDIDFTAID
jgi:large subunit ribosomal protein L23